MESILNHLFDLVIPLILTPVVGWLGVKLSGLITANVKNRYLQNVLLRLDDAVLTAVTEVEQTMKGAPSGQKKQAAIDYLKTYVGKRGYLELKHVLGLDDDSILDLFEGKIEAAVFNQFRK